MAAGRPAYDGGCGDGVVVIPAHLAAEVADASYEQERFEEFVIAKVKDGRSIFGLYPPDAGGV